MSKLLAGLIKLPCHVRPINDQLNSSVVSWYVIEDDRGLRFATVMNVEIAAAIAATLNHPSAPTDFDYAPHEAT